MENKWADTNALGNVATALGIYSLIPYFYGMTDNNTCCIPWMFGGLLCMFFVVKGNFVNGDVVSGTANAVLNIICLFGNLYHAVITLLFANAGLPENITQSLTLGDGFANLGSAIFCGAVAVLAWKANKLQSIAVMFPTVAFFLLFLMITGIAGPFGYVPMTCFVIFGTWLLYSAIAMLFHQATGKVVLPYVL